MINQLKTKFYNKKNGLRVAFVAIILLTIIIYSIANKPTNDISNKKVFPSLKNKFANIDKIIIKNNNIVTLVKDNFWHVKEKFNYPASAGYVKALLLNLADSKIIEAKTSNKDYYTKLGLDKKHATELEIFIQDKDNKDNNKIFIKATIGRTMDILEGTYLSIEGQPNVILASGDLRLLSNPEKWLAPLKLTIDNNYKNVTIADTEKNSLNFIKNESSDQIRLADLKIDEKPNLDSLERLSLVLDNLPVSDLKKLTEINKNSKITLKISLESFDKVITKAQIYSDQDKKFLVVKYEYPENKNKEIITKVKELNHLNGDFAFLISNEIYKILKPNRHNYIDIVK